MGLSKLAPARCQTAPKRLEVFQMRAEGLTFKEIGERMDLSPERCRQYVEKQLEELKAETRELAELMRDKRLKQLSSLIEKMIIASEATLDPKAISALVLLMNREARYLEGLDAPTKTQELGGKNPYEELSLEELKEEAKRRGIPVLRDNIGEAPSQEMLEG
jgi:DNA-binding transcriptional MerR regulator